MSCIRSCYTDDKAVDTHPISDGVNEDGRAYIQSDDLILQDIEDVDEPDSEVERVSPTQLQTTASASTNTRLNKRAVREKLGTAARWPPNATPGRVGEAWTKPHGTETKRWHILDSVRRKNKVTPFKIEDPTETDLVTQHNTRQTQERIDGRQSRLSVRLPHRLGMERFSHDDENEVVTLESQLPHI